MALNPAFRIAVIAGVEESVYLHIRRGDDIDAMDGNGATPLMLATARNRPEIVRLLLEHGADPSVVDSQGRNALAISKAMIGNHCQEILSRICFEQRDGQGRWNESENDEGSHATLGAEEPPTSTENASEPDVETNFHAEDSFEPVHIQWDEEEQQFPPRSDEQLRLDSIALQNVIGGHVPISREPDWEELDLFLPSRVDLREGPGAKYTSDIQLLLLQAARTGSVSESRIWNACRDPSGNRDNEAERRLAVVVADLGWEIDGMVLLEDSFDPVGCAPYEMRAIEDALMFLDNLTHGISNSIGLGSSSLFSQWNDREAELDFALARQRAIEFLRFPPSDSEIFWKEERFAAEDAHWSIKCGANP